MYPVTTDELPAVAYAGNDLHLAVQDDTIVRALRATDEDGLEFVAEGPGPGSNQSSVRGFVGPAHGALHLQAHDSKLHLWYPAGAGASRSPMRWHADMPPTATLPDFEYPSFDGTFIHDTNTVTRAGINTAIYYWRPQTVWTLMDFGQLWHAPFGDGSFPYELDDTDDIQVMGERGCCCLHAGLPSQSACVPTGEACSACGGNGPCRFPDD